MSRWSVIERLEHEVIDRNQPADEAVGRDAQVNAQDEALDDLDCSIGPPPAVQLIVQSGSRDGEI